MTRPLLVAAGIACGLLRAPDLVARDLTFQERVNAQAAIERVSYSHQIGATRPFAEAVPRAVLEDKVRTYLEESAALETLWKNPISAAALSRELERMERNTRMPDRLREIEVALGNDRLIILECLARPALADRLARSFFASDHTMHAKVPKKTWDEWWAVTAPALDGVALALPAAPIATPAAAPRPAITTPVCLPGDTWSSGILDDLPDPRSGHTLVWTGSEMIVWGGALDSAFNTGGRYDPLTDTWSPTSTAGAPAARSGHTAIWTGSRMIVWGGYDTGYTKSGGAYDPATDTWSPISSLGAPEPGSYQTAVWTGSEMIVWGGLVAGSASASGGRYNPTSDTWSMTSTSGAPAARWGHTAIWTGSRMIVWGGGTVYWSSSTFLNTGGRYDPATDTWSSASMTGAPSSRSEHTAVWTGTQMIVWGGADSSGSITNTGGRYDPAADTWTPTSAGSTGRRHHTTVWTGTLMIVWGGDNTPGGARYDPATDAWRSMSTINAPPSIFGIATVWTGTLMIAWGGGSNFGGRYDPATDTWTPTSNGTAPPGALGHTAIWSGSKMIVWGGTGPSFEGLSTGGLYDPATDTWSPTTTLNAPEGRHDHSTVWTGSEMIVWGGGGDMGVLDAGGRYDPIADRWSRTSSWVPRVYHNAVWTGKEMIVWGGDNGYGLQNPGGRYNPATDTWVATSLVNAPEGREGNSLVWTGKEMIVWGGYGSSSGYVNTGSRYDPSTDTWTQTSAINAPVARAYQSVVWTGRDMVIWGGREHGLYPLNSGGRYDPLADRWLSTSTTGAPAEGWTHTAVWTGSRMIVWVNDFYIPTTSGGLYDPLSDVWSPISLVNAPSQREYATSVWTGREMIIWGGVGDETITSFISGGRYAPDARYDPPVVDAGPDFAQECAAPGGTAVALHATAAGCGPLTYTWTGPFAEGGGTIHGADAVVTLPLGQSPLTLDVEDAHGQSTPDAQTVTVRDSTPPALGVQAAPPVLWPPNHRMVPVSVEAAASDACDADPSVTLLAVTSSEPDDAPWATDGATTGDIAGADPGTDDTSLALRAERDGSGAGRTYQLTYRAVDASGNATTAFTLVTVPHDQGHGTEPLLLHLEPGPVAGMARLDWPSVPEASGYDVIVGDLSLAGVVNGTLMLGPVTMLARGTTATSLSEGAGGTIPQTGHAFFYLIQSRAPQGPSGYGTESAPWPRIPSSCDGGCD